MPVTRVARAVPEGGTIPKKYYGTMVTKRLYMSRKPTVPNPPLPLPPEKAEEVRALLERVLDSHLFRGSRRCQTLLRHITEQTLAGDFGSLKERTLGIEVFGRSPDYDTAQDPVVRASAAEIRKKLAQYYQEPGHESETRIDLLSGSYIAEFHFDEGAVPTPEPAAVPEAPPPPAKRHQVITWSACGLGAALIVALVLMIPGWRRTDLDRLWEPMLKAPGTVLICVGQPVAYNLKSAQAQDAIQGIGGSSVHPPIREQDLLILWDRYVALDDALCLVHLTSLFEKYGKPYRIRGERSTTFADLRDTPAVLIAAFDNPWTLRVAGQLRFTFAKDSARETDWVHDRDHPDNTDWRVTGAWPNGDIPNDYAILSRVLDTTTDRPVVIAAGITQYGTMAAGEFLSNPEYFAEAVPKFSKDWQKKNLQIVLRVPVVNHMSGRPRVLTTHVW